MYKRQLLDTVLGKLGEDGKAAYEILETYKGKDLEYKEYEPLYQCAAECADKQHKKASVSYTHLDVYKRQPRSWCVYCPMGTMTQLICKAKNRGKEE